MVSNKSGESVGGCSSWWLWLLIKVEKVLVDEYVGVDDFGKVYMLMYMKVEGRILMDVYVDNYCMFLERI